VEQGRLEELQEEIGEVLVQCDKCQSRYWFTVVWTSDDFYDLWKGTYLHGCAKDGCILPVEPWQFREPSESQAKEETE